MNLLWRTIWHFLFARTTPSVGPFGVVSSSFRVLPSDLDLYGHMNNGRYLSISDVARFDLIKRRGVWPEMRRRGWYPVIASSTISYRKSLNAWQKYQIQSRFMGHDERNVYLEQRWVVGGDIYARLIIRSRFLARGGGHVPMDQLVELWGVEPGSFELPEWVKRWVKDAALPSARSSAPSEWD